MTMLTIISDAGHDRSGHRLALYRCQCGTEKIIQRGNVNSGLVKSCGCLRRQRMRQMGLDSRKPDHEIGYDAAHSRVSAAKGKAAAYACVDCSDPAREWSLRHDAPVTYTGRRNGYLLRFSADPSDYEPRCKNCHESYDSRS